MARTRTRKPKKKEMPTPYLTSFVGGELAMVHNNNAVGYKYSAFVDGRNGFLYGIPAGARCVLKFQPEDKSFATIGPDLGEGSFPFTWRSGVLAKNDNIYCAPSASTRGFHSGFLKINTVTDAVEILDLALPGMGGAEDLSWKSGALCPKDNCVYFMPFNARHVLKLDPDTETVSGVFLGDGLAAGDRKYNGTVVGTDCCLYGIPAEAKRIIKFDPSAASPDNIVTVVGEAFADEEDFECGNGVLSSVDGHIYAANNFDGSVLKIDPTKNEWCWIENDLGMVERGWGDPIIGVDYCIYWPPSGAEYVLKFDPAATPQKPASFVGVLDDAANHWSDYLGGALSENDGVIYCVPYDCKSILAIDPFNEFSMTLEHNLFHFPNKMGCLFEKKEDGDETCYENAVRKFGSQRILALLDKLLPFSSSSSSHAVVQDNPPRTKNNDKNDDTCTTSSGSSTIIKVQNKMKEIDLPLFIAAASCDGCHLDVVYHLLRRDLQSFLVCGSILDNEWDTNNNEGSAMDDSKEKEMCRDRDEKKKRKLHEVG